MNLADLLAALVDELEDVEVVGDREYLRNGTAFAALSDDAALDLRLGQEIAEAARRTPATSGSSRGDSWVRFAPAGWDEHAADRLEAWFRVAWRFAAGN